MVSPVLIKSPVSEFFDGKGEIAGDDAQRAVKDFDIRVGNIAADETVDCQNDIFHTGSGLNPQGGQRIAAFIACLRVGSDITLIYQIAQNAGNLTAIHVFKAGEFALRQTAGFMQPAQAVGVRTRKGERFHLRRLELGDGFRGAGGQAGKLFKAACIHKYSVLVDAGWICEKEGLHARGLVFF